MLNNIFDTGSNFGAENVSYLIVGSNLFIGQFQLGSAIGVGNSNALIYENEISNYQTGISVKSSTITLGKNNIYSIIYFWG